MEEPERYKSRVGVGGYVDHLPILFQIEMEDQKPLAPFKFNHTWLKEEGFKEWFDHVAPT